MAQSLAGTYLSGSAAPAASNNHTVSCTATNGNRVLVVGVIASTASGDPGISMTYNSVSPTYSLGSHNRSADGIFAAYAQWNEANLPSSGNATLNISFSTTPDYAYTVVVALMDHSSQNDLTTQLALTEYASSTTRFGNVSPLTSPNSLIGFAFSKDGTITYTPDTSPNVWTEYQDGGYGGASTGVSGCVHTLIGYDSTSLNNDRTTASTASSGLSMKLWIAEDTSGSSPSFTPKSSWII